MLFLFFDISTGEIFIILIVAFLIFGPSRIPEIARKIGRGMNEIRRASDEIKREITRETDKIGKDLNVDDTKFSEFKDTAKDIKEGMNKPGKEVKKGLDIEEGKDIGKGGA